MWSKKSLFAPDNKQVSCKKAEIDRIIRVFIDFFDMLCYNIEKHLWVQDFTQQGGRLNALLTEENRNYYFNKREKVKGSVATEHYHGSFELYYMKEGRCSYFIGDRSYDVISGDIILIPAGTIHRTNYNLRTHSRNLINFAPDFISPEILAAAVELGYLYSNKSITSNIDAIFTLIENEYQKKDSLSLYALKTHTEQLLLLMIRNTNEKKKDSEGNSIVEKAVKHIQENYMNEVRLSAVARLMNVSAEHLSRLFKKETGFGFNEYLTLFRLQRAEYILANEPGRAIGEIAYFCGFNDSNYFSYKFKQRYGVSPTKAREGIGTGAS